MIKKTTKIIALASAGIIALNIALINFSDFHDRHIRSKVGSKVVMIMNLQQEAGGTGWFFKAQSGKVVIITNKHVCKLASPSGELLVFEEGSKIPTHVNVVSVDPKHDLCAITAPKRIRDGLSLSSGEEVGNTVYVVGHPNLRPLVVTKGELIDKEYYSAVGSHVYAIGEEPLPSSCTGKIVERDLVIAKIKYCIEYDLSYRISAISYRGSSGSPVVNKWGNVIGVLFAVSEAVVNDTAIVKLEHLKEFVERF
jgi:S1-C subfamily serine protease